MTALTGMWDLLRAIGAHAARSLAAVEPPWLHERARSNAASAAALARAHRIEADEADRWIETLQARGVEPTFDPRRRSARS